MVQGLRTQELLALADGSQQNRESIPHYDPDNDNCTDAFLSLSQESNPTLEPPIKYLKRSLGTTETVNIAVEMKQKHKYISKEPISSSRNRPNNNPETASNIIKSIPEIGHRRSIAQVVPSLTLQLSIGQQEEYCRDMDNSLDLNIGTSHPRAATPPSTRNIFQSGHTGQKSGFSKWQRPHSKEGTVFCTRCFELPCWPIKIHYKAQASIANEQDCRSESVGISEISGDASFEAKVNCNILGGSSQEMGATEAGVRQNLASLLGLPMELPALTMEYPLSTELQIQQPSGPHLQMPFTDWLGVNIVPFRNNEDEDEIMEIPERALPGIEFDLDPNHLQSLVAKSEMQAWTAVNDGDDSCEAKDSADLSDGTKLASQHSGAVASTQIKNTKDSDQLSMEIDETPKHPTLSKMPVELIPSIEDTSLVEYLCAKKHEKGHFLDKIIVSADVYSKHPWNHNSGDIRGYLYFCCNTRYSMRGNMTRDRMTREGGRWKQQGMVHPILNVMKKEDAALKTYMSYIPCGKNTLKDHFIPNTPGRVKHKHRMIEIALQEDLKMEKLYFKFKVAPKPFLVVCVLKKA